ncbi:MAG: DUF2721 domain-containing protein [Roseiarcus sp.]
MLLTVEAGELSQVIAHATAPAFVLGAVASFVAVLLNRMTILIERIRSLNEIADDDARSHLKSDIPRLRRRVKLLNNATFLALLSALCTASLVIVAFASALFRLEQAYGAALLFALALILLSGSIVRFGQEVKMGLSEADHYR